VNLADLALGVAFLVLVVTGIRRGLIGFLLLALATLLSLGVAAAVALWTGTTPGIPLLPPVVPVVFFVTLIIVGAILRILAGSLIRQVHRSPFSLLDRLTGAVLAAAVGVMVMSLALYAVVVVPLPNPVTREVESATTAPLVLDAGARLISAAAGPMPFLAPLAARLAAARDELEDRGTIETRGPWRSGDRTARSVDRPARSVDRPARSVDRRGADPSARTGCG
jgi:hypothetical protein